MPRSRKPQLLKSAVVAKALTGDSKTKIAKDLGMTRNTVNVILNESHFNDIVAEAKYNTYALLNDATDACRYQLRKKHNGNIGLELLKGVGILRSGESAKDTSIKVIVVNALNGPPQEMNASATDTP